MLDDFESMDDVGKLEDAKALIKEKKYKAARHILEGMPHNQTAKAWLTKLDARATSQASTVKPQTTKVRKKSGSPVGLILAGGLLLVIVIGVAGFLVLRGAGVGCSIDAWWKGESGAKAIEFIDNYDVAETTARMGLPSVILNMQTVYRDFQRLETPDCAKEVKAKFDTAMSKSVDGFQSFASQDEILSRIQLADAWEAFGQAGTLLITAGATGVDTRLAGFASAATGDAIASTDMMLELTNSLGTLESFYATSTQKAADIYATANYILGTRTP